MGRVRRGWLSIACSLLYQLHFGLRFFTRCVFMFRPQAIFVYSGPGVPPATPICNRDEHVTIGCYFSRPSRQTRKASFVDCTFNLYPKTSWQYTEGVDRCWAQGSSHGQHQHGLCNVQTFLHVGREQERMISEAEMHRELPHTSLAGHTPALPGSGPIPTPLSNEWIY